MKSTSTLGFCAVVFFLVCVLGALTAARAQEASTPNVAPLSVEAAIDWTQPRVAYGPVGVISPDGALIADVVQDANGSLLRLTRLATGKSERPALPCKNVWAPTWSPDGRSLALFGDVDGRMALCLYDVGAGRARVVGNFQAAGFSPGKWPLWSPDGRHILISVNDQVAEARASAPPPSATIVFRANRPGKPPSLPSNKSFPVTGLALIDVESGARRDLFRGFVVAYHLSASGKEAALIERLPRDSNKFEITYRIHAVTLETGASRTLVENTSFAVYGRFSWSPDGNYVAWVSDYAPETGPAYVVSLADGARRKIEPTPDVTFASEHYGGKTPLWSADSKRLFLVGGGRAWVADPETCSARPLTAKPDALRISLLLSVDRDRIWLAEGGQRIVALVRNDRTKEQGFVLINLSDGALSPRLVRGWQLTDEPVISPDGRSVIFRAESSSIPPNLRMTDAALGESSVLSPMNPAAANLRFGEARLITWKNSRGDELSGAYLLPSNTVPGRAYPMVVDVYAGEKLSNAQHAFGLGAEMRMNLQVLATRGYIVFRPDSRLRVGTPVDDLAEDILSGIDAMVTAGLCDPARLGVIGHSYGGYSTIALLTRSARFRAAVAASGFADLLSGIYGNEGKGSMSPGWAEGAGQGRMGGSPWEFPQRYQANSPMWNLDKVRTPLLLIHGTADDTVPAFASTMVFNGLQRLGREVEYVQYIGEGHGIERRSNLIDLHTRILAWFEEHL